MRRDTAEEQKGKEPSSSSAYGHMARGQEERLKESQKVKQEEREEKHRRGAEKRLTVRRRREK